MIANPAASTAQTPPPGPPPFKGVPWVPGGAFTMGSDARHPEEAPAHRETVADVRIDRHQVTDARSRRFVKATGCVTAAERTPDPAARTGHPFDTGTNHASFRRVARPGPG